MKLSITVEHRGENNAEYAYLIQPINLRVGPVYDIQRRDAPSSGGVIRTSAEARVIAEMIVYAVNCHSVHSEVLAERARQILQEGWSHAHDDAQRCDEIAAFAALYAMPPAARDWSAGYTGYGSTFGEAMCPEGWAPKFGDRRRELVKAGALIIAEIERLDRANDRE